MLPPEGHRLLLLVVKTRIQKSPKRHEASRGRAFPRPPLATVRSILIFHSLQTPPSPPLPHHPHQCHRHARSHRIRLPILPFLALKYARVLRRNPSIAPSKWTNTPSPSPPNR